MNKLDGIILNAKDALEMDTGFLVYEEDDVKELINYVILTYSGHHEVYLHLFDDEYPYRDMLVKGVDEELEEAKKIAIAKLQEILKEKYH